MNIKCEYCGDTGAIYGTQCGACSSYEEQMRKDFEEWAASKGFNTKLREDTSSSDTFFAYETEQRWVCWQASRESLVVELPEVPRTACGGNEWIKQIAKDEYKNKCIKSLESQGIKWK